jgi:heptosyltransferase III
MKILVIRRDNIGDLVCTTPLFASLRQHCPNARIDALVNSYNGPVLAGNPDLDQVYVYSKYKHVAGRQSRIAWLRDRLALLWQLRRQKFDLIILAKSSFDQHGLRFARQIGGKKILGFAPVDGKAVGLDIAVPEGPGEHEHEVEMTFRLLPPLGIHTSPGSLKVVPVRTTEATATRPIALHISAREAERQWPIEKWTALTHQLLAETSVPVMLLWAPGSQNDPAHPGDDQLAAALLDALSEVERQRVLPRPTQTLPELVAALSEIRLLICCDGGALHIASGLGKPVVGLFQNHPIKYNHWYPWDVPHQVVRAPISRVEGIEVAVVTHATLSLLEA